jgi:hypothetical protein
LEKMAIGSAGYLLHVLIEIPAAITFFLAPSRQLGSHTPQAHAVIRQYAILLLSSVVIALAFAWQPENELSGSVAGALALYHIGPGVRSTTRLAQAMQTGTGPFWEPALYLAVHTLAGAILAHGCWTGVSASRHLI